MLDVRCSGCLFPGGTGVPPVPISHLRLERDSFARGSGRRWRSRMRVVWEKQFNVRGTKDGRSAGLRRPSQNCSSGRASALISNEIPRIMSRLTSAATIKWGFETISPARHNFGFQCSMFNIPPPAIFHLPSPNHPSRGLLTPIPGFCNASRNSGNALNHPGKTMRLPGGDGIVPQSNEFVSCDRTILPTGRLSQLHSKWIVLRSK